MATERQKAAINKLVEMGGKSVSAAMREAVLPNGERAYSPETAHNPQKLTESKGFLELCEEHGLTDSLIVDSLTEDIKMKPQNRKGELELATKIKGLQIDKLDITSKGKEMKALTEIEQKEIDDVLEEL